MSELVSPVKPDVKVKRKYVKTGLNSKKYKEFIGKTSKRKRAKKENTCSPIVNNRVEVDTSDPKYHNFEHHDTFERCLGCGSILRSGTTGCQYCVRKDRQG